MTDEQIEYRNYVLQGMASPIRQRNIAENRCPGRL